MTEQVRYCIILRTGPDKGAEIYRRAPRDRIDYMFSGCKFTDREGNVTLGMAHIAGNNTKHGEEEDAIKLNVRNPLSVVLTAYSKRTANRCMKYWKIPAPFYRRMK